MEFSPLPDGIGRTITQAAEVARFLTDFSGRITGQAHCVVQPASTAEVVRLVRWCHAHRVALVPQGGNTGLAGGSVPTVQTPTVLLSTSRLNRLRAIDTDGNTVTVESGMVLQQLQTTARAHGRLFPLSLGAEGSCTVGGNLGTNAGGTAVLRYGNMRELCLGLEVVLPDGEVLDGLSGLRKDNTGYDLRNLFIGAEGTLGIITAATLKLFPLPAAKVTAWCAVDSPEQALKLLALAQGHLGPALTAFELMSDYCVRLVEAKFADAPRILAARSPWYILLESSDQDSEAHAIQKFEDLLARACEQAVASDAAIAQNHQQSAAFWTLRERIGLSQKRNFKHDISLPIGTIPRFIEEARALVDARFPGCTLVVLGHIGDGNLHYNVEPPPDLDPAAFGPLEARVHAAIYDKVVALQGSISAEHGIGSSKAGDLLRYKSPVAIGLMRKMKAAIDPHSIMNPGKVLA
jgi:FAD/FMN-containing dehydrogenase